ncbi:putative tRNA-splicing endonuclease subunit tsp-2 [Cladobotryum mycophilum]|uniref:tRNA-intron lyase n=1 Tax=Cladobotryum mycophilum TaxID=491253 RepID=A0ABR0SNM1_9HYPO
MAEIQPSIQPATGEASSPTTPKSGAPQKRGPSIHQIYALPTPIRTFPLPTFYPNNPISLFHVAYAWLGQVWRPPLAEPSVIHHGIWSETTISVHIIDEKSMRALWEQGFYGKGSLSRSEPNWLKREQVRKGLEEAHVSEIFTVQRREERAQAKWERARLEQEAIEKTRLEEAKQAEARRLEKLATIVTPAPQLPVVPAAPVGPREILALPNSAADLITHLKPVDASNGEPVVANGRVNGLAIPADSTTNTETEPTTPTGRQDDDQVEPQTPNGNTANGSPKTALSRSSSSDFGETKTLKRRKSVRFSPTVESATFNWTDPPSPKRNGNGTVKSSSPVTNGNGVVSTNSSAAVHANGQPTRPSDPIINKEHLQLMPEEVFFLAFGLGVLTVTDPGSGKTLSPRDLFTLFRQYSYFPPRNGPDEPDLVPDDGFLVNYAVYHHFRSLGWVPRAGIKFGVDWMLYTRGPVFDHAEFGLIVIPSFSDAWWQAAGKTAPQKTWAWLHSVVRVLSHVTKSLVLVYVDVPPPPKFEAALEVGITEALKLYKVREVMVKRWSSNRNR